MKVVSLAYPFNITSDFLVSYQYVNRDLMCVTIHCLEASNIFTESSSQMRPFTQSNVRVNRLNTSSPEEMLINNFLGIWNKSAGRKYLPADSEVIGATDRPYWQIYIVLSIHEN